MRQLIMSRSDMVNRSSNCSFKELIKSYQGVERSMMKQQTWGSSTGGQISGHAPKNIQLQDYPNGTYHGQLDPNSNQREGLGFFFWNSGDAYYGIPLSPTHQISCFLRQLE